MIHLSQTRIEQPYQTAQEHSRHYSNVRSQVQKYQREACFLMVLATSDIPR